VIAGPLITLWRPRAVGMAVLGCSGGSVRPWRGTVTCHVVVVFCVDRAGRSAPPACSQFPSTSMPEPSPRTKRRGGRSRCANALVGSSVCWSRGAVSRLKPHGPRVHHGPVGAPDNISSRRVPDDRRRLANNRPWLLAAQSVTAVVVGAVDTRNRPPRCGRASCAAPVPLPAVVEMAQGVALAGRSIDCPPTVCGPIASAHL